MPLKVYIVEGVADNPAVAIEEARRYWGQLCVDLQQVGGIETIPDPDEHLRKLQPASSRAYYYDSVSNTEVDCLNERYDPTKPNPLPKPAVCLLDAVTQQRFARFTREAPSEDMRELIAAAPLLPGEVMLRVIVVSEFENPTGSGTAALGYAATTDVNTVKRFEPTSASLQAPSVQESGVLFVVKNANGQAWAHEIAHVVVGEFETPTRCVNPVHVDCDNERPNILWPVNKPLDSVGGKRFNGKQLDLLYRSNRYVRYPAFR